MSMWEKGLLASTAVMFLEGVITVDTVEVYDRLYTATDKNIKPDPQYVSYYTNHTFDSYSFVSRYCIC